MQISVQYKTVGKWKENSYLLEYDNEAWLIDPGDEFAALDTFFAANTKNLKGIINTHGHFDHIGAVHEFKEKYKIPFYLHSSDKQILRQGNLYRKLAGDSTLHTTPQPDGFLNELPNINIGNKQISIHHTPGHTNGSVCFEIDKNLISGDLFFKDNIGRVDLPGGNKNLLLQSVDFVLNNFEGYMIYPGHGEPFLLDASTIQNLKSLL